MRKIIYLIILCLLLPVSCFAGTIPPGNPVGPSTPAPGIYYAASYGPLNDTTILSLVSTIGSNQATIVLTAGTWTISNNVTIPSNMSLLFMQGAVLNIASGKTVTINGPLQAGEYQIFSGSGSISFVHNKTIEKYNLMWWGPPNDKSADAQPAIQAAINAVPDGAILYAPVNQTYAINSTITISNRNNLQFITSSPNMNLTGQRSTIQWNGPAGGTVIDLDRARYCTVSGWVINATNANIGIVTDGYSVGEIGTANIFADNNISNHTVNSNFIGISISPTSQDNQEFMKIRRNVINCYGNTGEGIYFGTSPNSHGHVLDSNTYEGCAMGINAASAGFEMQGINDFNSNGIDIQVSDVNFPTIISFADTEGSGQFLNLISSSNGPVTVDHCRIASPGAANTGIIAFGAAAEHVHITDNVFTPPTAWIFDLTNATTNLDLLLSNNRYMGGPVLYNLNVNNVRSVLEVGDRVDGNANVFINQMAGYAVANFNGMISQTPSVISNVAPTSGAGTCGYNPPNRICPTTNVITLGSGLLKTITPSNDFTGGVLYIIPSAAFTTDTTGNIAVASTAVVGKPLIMVYDGTKWWPSY